VAAGAAQGVGLRGWAALAAVRAKPKRALTFLVAPATLILVACQSAGDSSIQPAGRALTVHAAERVMAGGAGRPVIGAANLGRLDTVINNAIEISDYTMTQFGPTIRLTDAIGNWVSLDVDTLSRITTWMIKP
jgi:hypothetical protein